MKTIRALARSTAHALMIALALTFALALIPSLSRDAQAAGGKASTFENALLKLVFNGNTVTGIADNTASTPATVLCLALHTADPGSGGTQTTNEAAYGSYARVAVNRNSGGWTVSGNQVALTAIEQFPAATSGSETETYFSVAVPTSGSTCTGSLVILYRGPVTPNIVVSTGVTPELTTSTLVTEQ
jgi:hypothetical protein